MGAVSGVRVKIYDPDKLGRHPSILRDGASRALASLCPRLCQV